MNQEDRPQVEREEIDRLWDRLKELEVHVLRLWLGEKDQRLLYYEAAEWIRFEAEEPREEIKGRHSFKKGHECPQCRLITRLYHAAGMEPYE